MNFDECEVVLKFGVLVLFVRFFFGDDRLGNNNVCYWFLYINVIYIFYFFVYVFFFNIIYVLIYLF